MTLSYHAEAQRLRVPDVQVDDVVCPTCRSAPGDPCKDGGGRHRAKGPHDRRCTAARRQWREDVARAHFADVEKQAAFARRDARRDPTSAR